MLYSNRVSEMLKRKITSEIEDWHQNGTTGLLIDGARQIGKTTIIEEYLTSHQLNYIEFNLLSNKLALEAFNTASDEKNCCSVYPLFQEKRLSKVKRFSSSMKSRKRMMPSRPSSSSSRIRNTSLFFWFPAWNQDAGYLIHSGWFHLCSSNVSDGFRGIQQSHRRIC